MRNLTICVGIMLVWLTVSANAVEPKSKPMLGLSTQEGELLLNGKPYRGIGANYFSLFNRLLKDPADTSYRKGLKQLSQAKVPFIRFMACGFWPVDWELYLNDKKSYYKHLDDIVIYATKNEIGLIPSLFWNMSTVPDIVGEPMDQLGNPNSKTIAFIRHYTTEVVLRYRNSPAIWGWEFGNEYNLHVDLPNASKHRPRVIPQLKTGLNRTQRDELSSEAMLTAFNEFAKTVRQYDKHRILITGNSIPRPTAYHNSKEKSYQKDFLEQFQKVLLRDNPDPFKVICVHTYPREPGKYSARAGTVSDLIKNVQKICNSAKKPLFIGEFGAPLTLGKEKERSAFLEILTAIETNEVPLAAFWVFDYSRQNREWNVTFSNERRYMLNLVTEANQRIKNNSQGQ